MHLKDKIIINDEPTVTKLGGRFSIVPPVQIKSNVSIKLIESNSAKVVEKRSGHNIFLNYGRDWIAHLIGYDTAYATFREDRVRYIAVGIGGTSQLLDSATIRAQHTEWAGFADDWSAGGGPYSDPTQVDTDAAVTALEWPVQITNGIYYDDISAPATFPATGIIRFTSVLGVNEVNFGSFASVPLSEIGLFTSGIATQPGGLATPPIVHGTYPAEKFMVAYHTFDTLSKTTGFVLQVDWELRFS